MGYYHNECKVIKKDKDSNNKTNANVLLEESNDALIYSLESKTTQWVLDSRALFHATSSRGLFKNYISSKQGKVYLGDDQARDVIVKGEVQIKLNESVWNLKNVRHVPNLRKNLFSIKQVAK